MPVYHRGISEFAFRAQTERGVPDEFLIRSKRITHDVVTCMRCSMLGQSCIKLRCAGSVAYGRTRSTCRMRGGGSLWGKGHTKGGRRQKTGGMRRNDAGGRKKEAGGKRRREAGGRRKEAEGRRQETGGRRQSSPCA